MFVWSGRERDSISEFAVLFVIFLSGMAVGLIFDFYRIVRWRIGLNKVLTFIGDILFSIAALTVIFLFAQKANYLEMRFYIFGGSLMGLLVYLKVFSRPFKNLFLRFTQLLISLEQSFFNGVKSLYLLTKNVLVYLMSFPYGLLRWFALLLYRILEALVGSFMYEQSKKMKNNCDLIAIRIKNLLRKFRKKE